MLSGLAALAAGGLVQPGNAETVRGEMPWKPGFSETPTPVTQGGLQFFTAAEAVMVAALADRLIPADALSPSASELGCVLFIDRQLAGDFGKAATMYRLGRFIDGTPEQGPQFKATPAERYRSGLAALERHCQGSLQKNFAALGGEQQDAVISALESGKLTLPGVDGVALFGLVLQNVRESFFADPMYGGNKNMAGWKMVGFPGARYDFRDVVDQRGKKLNIIPISMADKSA
jgi:gluconate 2-dehydrogenase gamma chain